jgi:7,8-dihydropterin-6-yl-methyl-4-(beta-D-ribofuranosyl)aminobenzene 5'-phosphate synthase
LLDDQALFIESPVGLIAVFGCAHAGVVNTLQRISDLNRTKLIYAVMGGMHLMNADSDRIEKTIAALREYNPPKIGPAHCTGENVIERMRRAFPEQYFDCSVGQRIDF